MKGARERFEEWAREAGGPSLIEKDGDYESVDARRAFWMWIRAEEEFIKGAIRVWVKRGELDNVKNMLAEHRVAGVGLSADKQLPDDVPICIVELPHD